MANEFIIRKGYKSLSDSQITGSLSVSNAVTASFFTGSFRGDGSELTGIDGFPFTGSATISGSLTVVGPVTAIEFIGNGSQLTGIDGFPFTGSAAISGSLTVDGNVIADSFTGSIQGTATTASYVNIANVDGFTAYSSSVNTAIGSVLDATTPITATINNTNSPFTITNQTIVIVDSTSGNVTVNLPNLNTVVGTPNQKPIIVYKNDYSQNVIYVSPSGSQLVNGTTQDIIVSIQIGIVYNPTSAGWVTEGNSYQSLAELELFFVPKTETGSLSVATASYVEYADVVNKPTLVSGSSQISFSGITGKPTLVSGSSQISFTGITNKPTLVSGSSQVTYSGLTGIPSGIVSSSVQVKEYNVFATTGSNQFNGNQSITGSLTVSGQVVAQTLNVQQVTSSIVYSSGSNVFGNNSGNTHRFTGSLQVSGSSHYLLGSVGVGVTSPLSRLHVNTGTNQNFRVRPGTDVGATNGVAINSRTDDDGSLQQLTLRASDVIMLPSGNVGINTASPSDFIDAGLGLAIISTTGRTGLSLGSNQTVADEVLGRLSFTNTNSTNIGNKRLAYISGVRGNTDNSAYLEFGTANNGLGTQRMVISQTGNVGIGVTPSAWNSTSRALQLSSFISLSQQHSGALNLMSYAFESSPNTFTYGETGVYPTRLSMNPNDGTITFFGAGTGTAGNAITWASRLAFTSTGAATFSSSVTAQSIKIENTAAAAFLYFNNTSSPASNYIALGSAANELYFQVNGSDRMIIKSNGNVLIGTTSDIASSKLRVNGNIQIDGFQKMTTYYIIVQPNTTGTITISSPTGTYMQGSMQVMAGGYGNSLSGNVTGLWMVGGLLFFDNSSTSTITQIVNSVTANGSMSFQRSSDQYTVTLANTSSLYTKTFYVSVIINGD